MNYFHDPYRYDIWTLKYTLLLVDLCAWSKRNQIEFLIVKTKKRTTNN